MGEKGNITSEELAAAAAGSGGVGAVVAGAGTSVTAVFEEAGGALKDKVIDKGADAGIAAAQEKWRERRAAGEDPAEGEAPPEGRA